MRNKQAVGVCVSIGRFWAVLPLAHKEVGRLYEPPSLARRSFLYCWPAECIGCCPRC